MKYLRGPLSAFTAVAAITLSACEMQTTMPIEQATISQTSINLEHITPEDIVASITESGGCARVGKCYSFDIRRNGKVDIFSPEYDEATKTSKRVFEKSWTMPAKKVEAWLTDVAETDFDALYSSFGKGRCQGCVDGIDSSIVILPKNGDYLADTITYNVSETDNVFGGALRLLREGQLAGIDQ